MAYFTCTFKVDPSGALLCVQQVTCFSSLSVFPVSTGSMYCPQLLNALFGMNAAAQHTFLHSPYLSSLSYEVSPLLR